MAMAVPIIQPGRGVKFFEEAHFGFGRQDATCIRVDNQDPGIIDLRTVKSNRRINNVHHLGLIADGDNVTPYWVELPEGYVPGSGGH